MNIPQEIKDKIEDKYPYIGESFGNASLRSAASYGYHLAQQEIQRLESDLNLMDRREVAWGQKVKQVEEEIERLKGLIEKAHIIKIIQ